MPTPAVDSPLKPVCKDVCDTSTEDIYESIDFPFPDEVCEQKAKPFEASCLNLGDHDDYRMLDHNQSQEYILEGDGDRESDTCNKLIFCFTCLFD